jgi:hypothetical protein
VAKSNRSELINRKWYHPGAAGGSPPASRGGRDVERPRPVLQRQYGHDFEAQDMSAGLAA